MTETAHSPSARGNHPALRSCWHPVAYSAELGDRPVPADLLDEPLVLWRDSSGTAHAFSDLCVHRGTALSLGTVEGDEIVCPYHGWRYGDDRRVHRDPAARRPDARAGQGAHHAVPLRRSATGSSGSRSRNRAGRCRTSPSSRSAAGQTVTCGPYRWACDASRQVENFTDFGHFPFVHPGLLGDPERPVVPSTTCATEGHVLHYEIVRPEAPNTDDFPVFANERRERPSAGAATSCTCRTRSCCGSAGAARRGCSTSSPRQPVGARTSAAGSSRIGRNYNLDQPDQVLRDFEDVIFDQDQRIVESQRPERVPFDLADELHLKFDAVAVAYRRAMRTQGLAQ